MLQISDHHPVTAMPAQVNRICEPLFQRSPISYFEYVKIYNNGQGIKLDTKEGFLPYIYNSGNRLNLSTIDKFNRCQFISTRNLPSGIDKKSLDIIQMLSCRFDIDNVFTFRICQGDVLELISFATDRRDDWSVVNYYYSHIDFLENFISYFKIKASNLIAVLEKSHNILFYNDFINHIDYFSKDVSCNDDNNSYPEIIFCDNGKTSLTKREWECLKHIAHGRTAKEIARILLISYRTVESYIDNVKQKVGCNSKSELSDIYWLNKKA